eukprot:scaffold145213_cov31-Tisochrysis_lutea.AAC.5
MTRKRSRKTVTAIWRSSTDKVVQFESPSLKTSSPPSNKLGREAPEVSSIRLSLDKAQTRGSCPRALTQLTRPAISEADKSPFISKSASRLASESSAAIAARASSAPRATTTSSCS